jgi:hypothetical protein
VTCYRHGMYGTPTYASWQAMLNRCSNPASKDYPAYCDVPVCAEWKDFKTFLADMGERPEGKTLDRIKGHLGYNKGNCRWATAKQQANNRKVFRNNRSGITGVHYVEVDKVWRAWAFIDGKKRVLYRGKDFFEACCARKSWESGCEEYRTLGSGQYD